MIVKKKLQTETKPILFLYICSIEIFILHFYCGYFIVSSFIIENSYAF